MPDRQPPAAAARTGDGSWTEVPTLSQAVADWVATGIVNGRWQPGDRLRELDIAGQLNISRAPIREAMRILHEKGLVEHSPRTGAVVNEFSTQTIMQVYRTRAALESWLVRTAVPALTSTDRQKLAEHLGQLRAAQAEGRLNDFFEIGWTFRMTFYSAADNRVAVDVVHALRSRLHSLPQVLRSDLDHVADTVEAYSRMCEAAERGDVEQAGQELERFLLVTGDRACAHFGTRSAHAVTPPTPVNPA